MRFNNHQSCLTYIPSNISCISFLPSLKFMPPIWISNQLEAIVSSMLCRHAMRTLHFFLLTLQVLEPIVDFGEPVEGSPENGLVG